MGDLRITTPVGVPPNIQRPQPPLSSHDIITTISTDTKLASSSGTAEQLKTPSPPQDSQLTWTPGTMFSVSSPTITSAVRSVTTSTSQPTVSPSTASKTAGNLKTSMATPIATHTNGSPGPQMTPVCSGISVPKSLSDTGTVTTAPTIVHTPTSGGAPTVTIRSGGQARIFTPQKPLQLTDCPRAQLSTVQTGQ